MLSSFFDRNRRICSWIEDRLPDAFTENFNRTYENTIRDIVSEIGPARILDIGGGKKCHIVRFCESDPNNQITALDIDFIELSQNNYVKNRVIGDATKTLPFNDGSFELVTSRSLLEHISDASSFFKDAGRVLRTNGYFIHLCPGRYAPFAVLNRLLPHRLAAKILYFFHPQYRQNCGFYAFYQDTYHDAVMRNLKENGYCPVNVQRRYYQSFYFSFFVPLYLVSLFYDFILFKIQPKNLASQLLIVAKKTPPEDAG